MFGGNQKFQIALATSAIGLKMFSTVSWTDVCTDFCAKMANTELTDNASAAIPTSRMKAFRKICLLLYSSSYLSKVVSCL